MAKTSAKIVGLDQVQRRLKTFIKSTEGDPRLLTEVANVTRDEILRRTRSRLDEYKQPKLQDSTVKRRKELIAIGNGSEFSKPSRSNLTLSGQLLDSIAYTISTSRGVIQFFLKKNRVPYLGISGKNLKTKTNPEIKNDLEKRGFRFFFISDSLASQLSNRIKQSFRRRLANFKKLNKNLK